MGPNPPAWVQHIAFCVKDRATLLEFHAHLESNGIDMHGVTDHGTFHSTDFFLPNDLCLELACPDPEEEAMINPPDAVSWDRLETLKE